MERTKLLNPERLRSFEKWQRESDVKLFQINGQRKYGGPPNDWQGPVPQEGCEVFISQIPREVYEDLLIPLFSSVGPLWEFRLMMNFSGQNRGFAYAKYGSQAIASSAVRQLHGHKLEPGVCLSVRRSIEKRQLSLWELPYNTKQEQLLEVLRNMSEGVERVSLKSGPDIEGVTAIVVYSSHHAASMAKKVLVESFKKRFALSLTVKWHTTNKAKDEGASALVRHPRNVPPSRRASDGSIAPPLPPRLLRPPSCIPGFSRAVGGPTISQAPRRASSPPIPFRSPSPLPRPSPAHLSLSPVTVFQKLCEVYSGGPPLYNLQYSHTGPDGFLFFNYHVYVPGMALPFTGVVKTLPGPTVAAVQADVQQATAEHILQSLPLV